MPTAALVDAAPITFGEPPWRVTCPATTAGLPPSCDVAIVGAGVTGLACALALAPHGEIVVIDRAFGGGAAARSGGLIVGDTLIGPVPAFDGCEIGLRDWIAAHHAECDLQWTGCWELDRRDALDPAPIDWSDAGCVRVARTVSGGTCDPGALVSALAAAAHARGARLVDGVALQRFTREASHVLLDTTRGQLRAQRVVIAVDAAGQRAGEDAWPERVLTVALETDPLETQTVARLGWRDRQPFYTNELPLLWGRTAPGGGLIAGRELVPIDGRKADDLRGAFEAAGARLVARVRALHPALARVGVRRIWAGPIARDASGVPRVLEDPAVKDVWWAGGYGGHGLAQAFRLGTLAGVVARGGVQRRRTP